MRGQAAGIIVSEKGGKRQAFVKLRAFGFKPIKNKSSSSSITLKRLTELVGYGESEGSNESKRLWYFDDSFWWMLKFPQWRLMFSPTDHLEVAELEDSCDWDPTGCLCSS